MFEDGELAIVTPCATGTTGYAIDGANLRLEGATLAAPVCPDEEFATRIDADMREVLADGVVAFEIDAQWLMVTRGDVGLYLRAR